MCGIIDNLFSGDNLLSTIASVASIVPGPWQVPAMMANGVLQLSNDNLLGALGGFAGGMGGFSNLTANLGAGTDMLGSLDDIYNDIGSGLGAAASSGGSFGNLGDIFQGLSLPTVGGGSGINAADVFNMFPDAMQGAAGDILGGGLGTTMSGVNASLPSNQAGTGSMGGISNITSMPPIPDMTNVTFASQLSPQNQNLAGTLQDLFEKGKDIAEGPWGKVAGGLLKGFGAYQDYRGARNAQKALQGQLDELNQLYSPNSPYAQQMRQRIERRDAARGRRSQYGPRERELAASLTNARSAQLASPGYTNLNAAVNQSALPWGSVFGAGQSLLSGLGDLFS